VTSATRKLLAAYNSTGPETERTVYVPPTYTGGVREAGAFRCCRWTGDACGAADVVTAKGARRGYSLFGEGACRRVFREVGQ